jgi:hypothetical protein
MAEKFEPVTLYKNGEAKVVSSVQAFHQARFDGWTEDDNAAKRAEKLAAKSEQAEPTAAKTEELGGQKPTDPSKVEVKNAPAKPANGGNGS